MQAPMQFQTTLIFDRALLIPQVVSNKKAGMLIALRACLSPLRTETILTYHLSLSKPWCSIDCIKHHVSNENLWSRSMAFRSDITNCLLQDSIYSVRGTCGSLALKKRNRVLWEAKVGERRCTCLHSLLIAVICTCLQWDWKRCCNLKKEVGEACCHSVFQEIVLELNSWCQQDEALLCLAVGRYVFLIKAVRVKICNRRSGVNSHRLYWTIWGKSLLADRIPHLLILGKESVYQKDHRWIYHIRISCLCGYYIISQQVWQCL